MSGVAGSRESWRVWWGRLTPWTLTPEGQAKQGLCSEALTPSGLVPPPEMGPSRSPSPTLHPAERLLWPGRASPSASQLLAFSPGKEQAAGVPSRASRARTRSPSPRTWRPDFPGAAREAP